MPLRLLALILALAAAPAPAPAAADDRKPDLDGVVRTLTNLMKRRSLSKRDPEVIGKRIDGLSEDDLAWVLDRLREVEAKDRGDAAPRVEGMVSDALLVLRYGEGILELPDAAKRVADPTAEARCALLADLSRLKDPEPATRLATWALSGGDLRVRLRAVDTLADLASWGGDGDRLYPALRQALEDPSPAVRDLALERLVNLCDPAALDWCLEHAGDPAEETAEVRGRDERRCPGERAFATLARHSKLHFGVEPSDFAGKPAEEREAILEDFRRWRKAAGGNPLRNGDDGPFDPLPRVTTALVGKNETRAAARWWSEVDRAQFRLDLDGLQVVHASPLDQSASFRLTVMASGARQGTWEAFARNERCGTRFRLPRKGFGLVEVAVQPLQDGRLKMWVHAYESR